MSDDKRHQMSERQRRLREAFLDLANVYMLLRMQFLRMTGRQPPEGGQPPARGRREPPK